MTSTNRESDIVERRASVLQKRLSDSGHRITPQRLHVLNALLSSSHPTAEELWDSVRRVSPTTSLGTIYKTLDTLKEMGEVIELDTHDDRRHYDAVRPFAHPHIICNQCAKIDDVDVDDMQGLRDQAARHSGYLVYDLQVVFYGLCRACAR